MGNSSISVAVPFLRMAGKYLAGGGKTNFFTGFFLLERATFSPVKKVRMFMKKKKKQLFAGNVIAAKGGRGHMV